MLKKILIYIFWVILAVYMLFSLVIIPNIPDNNQCKGVLITVDNDENGNLSKESEEKAKSISNKKIYYGKEER